MLKNILITGASGQLGSELKAISTEALYSQFTFHFVNRNALDIVNKSVIESMCKEKKIDIIINCAAYTAVDKAEDDAVGADAINHIAVKHMAEVAKDKGIQLIHISTDYVFDGTSHRPYVEEDEVNPQGVYGRTKLDGENAMIAINPANSMIIRTSWVYSTFGNNFVKTMIRLGNEKDSLGVIFDQVGTPTYAKHLAEAILTIVQDTKHKSKKVEIYNYSNEGVCSWYDFSKSIFELENIICDVSAIESSQYPTPAKRPHYSVLNKKKIKQTYSLSIPHWADGLKECLETLK